MAESRPPVKNQKEETVVHTGRKKRPESLPVARKKMAVTPKADPDADIVRIRTGVDGPMVWLILIILGLGTLMVASASFPSALAKEGDSLHYIKRQLIFLALGLTAMVVLSLFPPGFYKRMAPLVFGVALVMLILVLIPGIGIASGEARRWLGIRGTPFTFQPSEFMKAALVLFLAWYLEKYREAVIDRDLKRSFTQGFVIPCGIFGVACLLVLLERHLSGTVILGLIGLMVLFIGGVRLIFFIPMLGAGFLAAMVFLMTNPYAMERIKTFYDKEADKTDEAWQVTQGLYAIGSGGTLGVGFTGSRQKYSYVSEAQNDFIFTIWCEEMGFVGAVVLIVLYILFVWRGYVIALRAPDMFSSLTAIGITSQVGIQVFLNIAVVTKLIPTTGVSLPFFSYGGTSLIILLAEMGILLSISKHSYQKR